MDSATEREAALAALAWQAELGADEAIGEAPVNRFELPGRPEQGKPPAAVPAGAPGAASAPPPPLADPDADIDPVAAARAAAARAKTLDELKQAIEAFPYCPLKEGAHHTVFADGLPGARVMILGEAPGREEDRVGRPFVGRAGHLLDQMFAAIGLSREAKEPDKALYISNIIPWRPPGNREPTAEEIAMMMPFVERHVELANPQILVLMGNTPAQAVLGKRGITRLRGHWTQALGRPVLPMFHPAYLLRNPAAKREAWADLLSLKARLEGR